MSHNLTPLSNYLEDITSPYHVAVLLDEILYDLVQHEGSLSANEDFVEKYFQVMQLRNQFAKMDERLGQVWK